MKTSKTLWSLNKREDRQGYSFLKPLEFKLITPQSVSYQKDEDKTQLYGYNTVYKYNNDTQVSQTIRRNEKNLEEAHLLKQRTLIELKGLNMVSKIHIRKFKNARINVYVSEFQETGFQTVNYQERIIELGNVPCKYILIEVDKGVPIDAFRQDIKIFGLPHTDIDNTFGMGFHDVLFDKTYQILYGFK
ncbi:UNKNOWN [Stylonychia lemnae]|uniref:Uncharacterized protein n=1 Tax=Stylonychia lemnae TaxID=5949 RepID=A0A078A047_STYLE|nr:UNKNOWN [Stylonychia lemnae]|eukprot:CDW75561.1 UNKNOWN [Stylonychia lemnae]